MPPSAKTWLTQHAACPAERTSAISTFEDSQRPARGSKISTVCSRVPEVPPSTHNFPPCAQAIAEDRGEGKGSQSIQLFNRASYDSTELSILAPSKPPMA